MAFEISSVAVKDGAGVSVGGGILAADVAGGGVGPFFFFHGLVDGVAGVNKVAIDASNRMAVLADLGATDNAVLDAIAASLATIDNIVAGNEAQVDVLTIAAGDNNIGNVDIVTVPADPFGANADAASATGSVSAKLRAIATALGTTALDLGIDTGGTRTLRVALDTASDDDIVTSVNDVETAVAAVETAITSGAVDAGTAGTPSVDVLTIQGVSGMTPVRTTPTPQATLGFSAPHISFDLDETHESIKASAGAVFKYRFTNFAASVRYVHLYNHASPTVGTTTPYDTILLPGAASADKPTVVTESFGGHGLPFTTAITIAATNNRDGTGSPSANDVAAQVYWV